MKNLSQVTKTTDRRVSSYSRDRARLQKPKGKKTSKNINTSKVKGKQEPRGRYLEHTFPKLRLLTIPSLREGIGKRELQYTTNYRLNCWSHCEGQHGSRY